MKVALVLGLVALMWVLAASPDTIVDLGVEALYLIEKK